MNIVPQKRLRVKLNPKLAESILKFRLDRPYRLWLVLRAMDADGEGTMDYVEARKHVTGYLKLMTRNTFDSTIKKGAGIFFERTGSKVRLVGLQRVCEAFDRKPGRPVLVPLSAIRKLKKFRSECLTARFVGAPEKPIAQSTLAKKIGRSTRTTWSYLKGVGRTNNAARVNTAFTPERSEDLPFDWRDDGYFVVPGEGVLHRLSCSYKKRRQLGARSGRWRKVRLKRDRARNPKRGYIPPQVRYVVPKSAKEEQKALHSIQNGQSLYMPYRPRQKCSNGTRLWRWWIGEKGDGIVSLSCV